MELTSTQLVTAFGRPLPTVKRWLRIWTRLGVTGIRRAKPKGAPRWSYLVSRDLLERWRRGELPAPHESMVPSPAATA
jgi:hypothetical protein